MLRCESCGNEETFHLYETITQLISLTCTPTEPNAYVVNEVLASYPMESEWGGRSSVAPVRTPWMPRLPAWRTRLPIPCKGTQAYKPPLRRSNPISPSNDARLVKPVSSRLFPPFTLRVARAALFALKDASYEDDRRPRPHGSASLPRR